LIRSAGRKAGKMTKDQAIESYREELERLSEIVGDIDAKIIQDLLDIPVKGKENEQRTEN
jgi:hypothetical protein